MIKTFQNNNGLFAILLCIAAYPVLPKGVQSILMILAGVWAIAANIAEKKWPEFNKQFYKNLLAPAALFFLYLFSLIYTQDFKTGSNFLVRTLPLFLFPLIFLLRPGIITTQRLHYLKLTYYFSVTAMLLIFMVRFRQIITDENASFWAFRWAIESTTKIHGTYLCMWIGFAIIIGLNELKHIKSYRKPYIMAAVFIANILFAGCWMIALGARMPLAATIISGLVVCFKNIRQFILISLVAIGACVVIVFTSDGVSQKIERLKTYDFSFPKGIYQLNYEHISSEQVRNGIYYCAYNKIKQSVFFGYGIGDVDNELQQCYDTNFTDTDTYKVARYNSHSQYLQLILSTGIAGLLLYLVAYGFLIKKAVKHKQVLYTAFLIFILINFLVENVLSRHDGIIFFALFNALFLFQDKVLGYNEESLS